MYGQGRPHLSFEQLKETPIALPPIREQGRIVAATAQLASVDQMVTDVVWNCSSRLARLRQSILRLAFEGRLVDQDPADEPASALLERIRAERAAGTSADGRPSRRRSGQGVRQERLL